MEKEIENLIEELIKVTPEMLSKKGLKLFNTIMAILNENAELKKNYINPSKARMLYCNTKKGTEVVIEGFVPKSKIKEKKEEEHQKCVDRFLYDNNETPSESYKYKYTEIDMNEYAGMEINRVLNELMEEK